MPELAMKVLMLGWDFSPRLTGGVGSACAGLAPALARAGAEVTFVLPHLCGDEEADGVRLLAGDRAHDTALDAARTEPPAALDEHASAPYDEAPPEERAFSAPSGSGAELASPAEMLRLLTIDSPLQPYLGQADYARIVHELLQRIRERSHAANPSGERGERRRAERRSVQPELVHAGAATRGARAPASGETAPQARRDARVPPYGVTLLEEVERYAREALASVQREAFDVVHAHDWMTFPAGMLLQEHTGKPLVCHFHSCEPERRGRGGSRDVRAVEQAALDAAQRVLCVSRESARTLRAHYALEPAKLRVLHDAFSPLDARTTPRGARREETVLYLGRLAQQKGPDVFLEAAAQVHERRPETRFVLSGSGELYPEIAARTRELGLERAVRFTGFLEGRELARAYAGADVYVMPSRSEPFGIGALEALSLGVPVIVSRRAGVNEVVRSCLKFDADDPAALADKILALLTRPALRRALIQSGLVETRKIRWDRPARALLGIYDEVVT